MKKKESLQIGGTEMKLYDTGVYLQNGQEIIPENQADLPVAKEEAAKNTIGCTGKPHLAEKSQIF